MVSIKNASILTRGNQRFSKDFQGVKGLFRSLRSNWGGLGLIRGYLNHVKILKDSQ